MEDKKLISNILALHKKTYNELAKEYESRAESLFDVTRNAMDNFSFFIKSKGLILDVGCGVGVAMNILAKKGFKLIGLDLSQKMIDFAKKRNPGIKIIKGDFLKTEFDEKFDAILTFAFIHLFPKSEVPKIFDKIKSILKPGGVALISSTEKFESKEGISIKEGYNIKLKRFRKSWTEQELRESISQSGFRELAFKKYSDPFNKIWMDFIVQFKIK
ncbi:MAG: class I SAM-dependent methyltransferase [Candidatus Paceibacterota bacterium]